MMQRQVSAPWSNSAFCQVSPGHGQHVPDLAAQWHQTQTCRPRCASDALTPYPAFAEAASERAQTRPLEASRVSQGRAPEARQASEPLGLPAKLKKRPRLLHFPGRVDTHDHKGAAEHA